MLDSRIIELLKKHNLTLIIYPNGVWFLHVLGTDFCSAFIPEDNENFANLRAAIAVIKDHHKFPH